jgi:hypothetical protein
MSKPIKQLTAFDQVVTLRERIAKLQAERIRLTASKRSRAEVATMLDATVSSWALTGHAVLAREVNRAAAGLPVELLSLRGVVPVPAAPGAASISLSAGPLLVALMGADAVKSALAATLSTVPEGMPTTARLARIAEIASELNKLEAEEEALIDAADGAIERRADARPEIILAVA